MNPFSTYLNSLSSGAQKSYGGLLSNLKAPTLSLPSITPQTSTQSPSAVTPVQTPVNTPASSSTAKSTYVANLSNPVSPSTSSVAVTPNPNQSQIDSTNAQIAALQAKVKSAQNAGYGSNDMISSDSTGAVIPKPVEQTPTQKYFSEYANATKSLASIQNQIDASTLSDREAQDAALAKSGGLLGGNDMAATAIGRQNADTLAKLGMAESGAARGVSALAPLQIGNSYIDPTTGNIIGSSATPANTGFSLSTGQTRYEIDPTTGQYTAVASNGASGTGNGTNYVPGADPTVDSWVKLVSSGQNKIADVPDSYKNIVAQGVSQAPSATSNIVDTTATSLKTLQDMVDNNEGFSGAVGFRGPIGTFTGPLSGTGAANFVAQLKQVLNDVTLPNLTILKGLGRVSQTEFNTLSGALSDISASIGKGGTSSLTQDEFKKQLTILTDQFKKISPQSFDESNSESSSASSADTGNNVYAESWVTPQ